MNLRESNFAKYLHLKLEEIREGYVKVSAEVREENLNIHGNVHGSFIFALADTAFEYISNFSRDSVALHMDIDFRRQATLGEKIIAEGFEESKGKTTSLYRIVVKNEDGKIIAHVTALAYHLDSVKKEQSNKGENKV
ncbi:phenylacetic acid degradation protein [Sulfolobus acidocaldarius SUSAZ]|nr:phenylacetic acid degradation protein [Sulfolobus acidocaldarius SUSAZ]